MQILHFSFEAVESMQTYNPRFSVLFVFEGGGGGGGGSNYIIV